jgi:sulfide:quinone oxidoreductase
MKPGVVFRRETITGIDPTARRVTTDQGQYEADVMVLALGADYDMDATPGLAEGGHEFYTLAGAERLGRVLPTFPGGRVVIGVAGAPFKCPPAPSEAALLLHDHLASRGVREASEITLVLPLGAPIPPAPAASRALIDAFAERRIAFMPNRHVQALDLTRRVVILDDASELPYDLFLGVPKHRVPDVVARSGLAPDGWIPVDPKTAATRFPGVYAVGDVTSVGTPKAGTFAEAGARVVAASILAELRGDAIRPAAADAGACYVEFGKGRVARVDVAFAWGGAPTGKLVEPSAALGLEKEQFGSSRRSRWFTSAGTMSPRRTLAASRGPDVEG